MAAELGETHDPKALVPGDVGAVADTVWAMREYGDALHEAGTGLRRIDTTDGWSGQAADQFRAAFQGQPGKWLEAGDCFHEAAQALDVYASTLQWAQQRAAVEALALWDEAETATTQAKAVHDHAVQQPAGAEPGHPTAAPIPFVDPGEAKREAARSLLERARSQLNSAGEVAADAVGRARDKAPEKPGFWSSLGHGLEEAGEQVYNGAASFASAIRNHPGDVVLAAAGVGLEVAGVTGEGLGIGLDLTGAGSIAGVPLNVASPAVVAAGAGMASAGLGDLARHAANDDRVSAMQADSRTFGDGVGRGASKTDRLKEHLTEKDLDAARRELDGEVVARKPNGQPWDHVDEVRNAQRGLVNRINQINRQLGDVRISGTDRATLEAELAEASRMLDHSEQYVPRG